MGILIAFSWNCLREVQYYFYRKKKIYYYYLLRRRGGDAVDKFSPLNGCSWRGRRTGVRPHRSMKSMREMVDDEQVGGIGCSFANFSYFTFAYALRFCTTQNDFKWDLLLVCSFHTNTQIARARTRKLPELSLAQSSMQNSKRF